jgi:hypothetical protein
MVQIDPEEFKTVLLGAAKVLTEMHWTQGVAARDVTGNPCHTSAPEAYSFCAMGAIHRAIYTSPARGDGEKVYWLTEGVMRLLRRDVGPCISAWNDTPGNNRRIVVEAFERAAANV